MHQDPAIKISHDTSIVHDVFGTDQTFSSLAERDQQIVLAQLQNLVMALRTNAKFRKTFYNHTQLQQQLPARSASTEDMTNNSSSIYSPMTPSSTDGTVYNNNNEDDGASDDSPRSSDSPPTVSSPSGFSVQHTGTNQQVQHNNNTSSSRNNNNNNNAQSSSAGATSSSLRHSFHASNQHPLVQSALSLRYRLLRPLGGPLSSSLQKRGLSDEQVLLEPFLQVMASSETTEPISAVAMVAVITFLDLNCEFISPRSIFRICETARITRGEVMDVQSHDAFLARIIQVFVAAFRHPAAGYVPEELPVKVFESIMRIGTDAQSELLRRVAEQGMNDIVSACFTHSVNPKTFSDPRAARFAPLLQLICNIITCDVSSGVAHLLGVEVPHQSSAHAHSSGGNNHNNNAGGHHGTRSPLAAQLQGLCLAHTALLVLRDHIAHESFRSVLSIVRNDLTRALLRVGKHSDHIVVLAQVLRTMHLLFSFASVHLVPQLVSFLQFILRRGEVVSGSAPFSPGRMDSTTDFSASAFSTSVSVNKSSGNNNNNNNAIAPRPRLEEIQVESLWEFCSHEAFPAFLTHHVDLSLDNNAVFGPLCWFLAETCIPKNAHNLNHINILPLDCLLVLLNHISGRIGRWYQKQLSSSTSSSSSSSSTPILLAPSEDLNQKKHYKQLLDKFIAQFKNDAAKKAVREIYSSWTDDERVAFGFPKDPTQVHGATVGQFLFKNRLRLDAKNLVDYVGEVGKGDALPEETDDPTTAAARRQWLLDTECEVCKLDSCRYHHEIRRGFIGSQGFRGKPLLLCVREFCFGFRVSGEAQKIDRIMEEFSVQWFNSNRDAPKEINPFKGKDAPFILAFAIIMLNTDLHIANLPKKMEKVDFVKRNRGLDVAGSDIPSTYLSAIYDDVKNQQLIFVDMLSSKSLNSKQSAALHDCDFDFTWFKEVEESETKAAQCKSIVSFQTKEDSALVAYDPFVITEFWRPCLETFLKILHVAAVCLPAPPNPQLDPKTGNLLYYYHYSTLRESLAFMEQTLPSVEMLESVNRGLQALALTGHRIGAREIPDFIVNCVLDFVKLDLATTTSSTNKNANNNNVKNPFEQIIDLGNRVSPLLSLDTLFRGFLVDVADSLSPESFMRLARCLISLLLCGAFDVQSTQNRITGNNNNSPQQQHVFSDLLLRPSEVASPPKVDIEAIRREQQSKAAAHQKAQSSGGGWFSGFFGGSSPNQPNSSTQQTPSSFFEASLTPSQQQRVNNGGYLADESASLGRLRSALPSLRELFISIDRLSNDSMRSLISSLVAVIDEGSLVAPKWRDELVSVGAAFVVDILIQCPSLLQHEQQQTNSNDSSTGIENLVRSFLEEQLDSASKEASSNIVKSILRYAQYYERKSTTASTTSSRVLKLVSCVQCLSPSAFSPIVRDILNCIDRQLSNLLVVVVVSTSGNNTNTTTTTSVDEIVWCAILRILKLAGRVAPPTANEQQQQHQQPSGDDESGEPSALQYYYYQPKYHALSILGKIVRSQIIPLNLSTEVAETAASFALLDIPLAKTSMTSPLLVVPSKQQHHQQQASTLSTSSSLPSPPNSPSAATNQGFSSSPSRQNSFSAPVRDDDLPIPILTAIHERLLENMNNNNNNNSSSNASITTKVPLVDIWLKFIVAITMALVAAAEHASNHSAMELLNALAALVINVPSLTPQKAVQLLEGVLLPVVDRVCTSQKPLDQQSSISPLLGSPSPTSMQSEAEESVIDLDLTGASQRTNKSLNQQQQSNNSKSRELSMFSPTDLLTYMLGPLAGPDTNNNNNSNNQNSSNTVASPQHHLQHSRGFNSHRHRCSDEVKSGVLRLISSTTMHYFDLLAAAQKQFLPLWDRVLASYYAIYSRTAVDQQQAASSTSTIAPDTQSEDVREAIQYTVVNLVRVTVTMAQEQEAGKGSTVFAMHPLFWKHTRDMLRRFDFGKSLDEELGVLGYS